MLRTGDENDVAAVQSPLSTRRHGFKFFDQREVILNLKGETRLRPAVALSGSLYYRRSGEASVNSNAGLTKLPKQLGREVLEIVSPVVPAVAALGLGLFIFEAMAGEHLQHFLGIGIRHVGLAIADPQQAKPLGR